MKNIWTKVATILVSIVAGLTLSGAALAAEATNSNTGADSNNEAGVTINNDVTITSNNNVNINNTISISANTGGNSADKNTGDGSVNTGDINFSVEIVNDLNNNFIGGPVPQGPADPGSVPPAVMPTTAAKPGQVLAAVEGLPITGSNLPSWPFLLIAIGFALKIVERVFKVKLIDEVV